MSRDCDIQLLNVGCRARLSGVTVVDLRAETRAYGRARLRELALDAARASEARWRAGAPLGAIDGVPATIKDIVWVKDWAVRYGTTSVPAVVASEDAPAVARLRDAGAVIEARPAPEVDEALGLTAPMFNAEANAIWRDTIAAAPEKMFVRIRERFESGAAITGPDHVAAWRRMRALRAIWAERVAGYDAVLLPTSPILPPDAARLMTDADYYVSENLLGLRNTRIANLFGLCALTLPTGVPSAGLMLMGVPNGEERLLRLGAAAEAALAIRRKSHNPA